MSNEEILKQTITELTHTLNVNLQTYQKCYDLYEKFLKENNLDEKFNEFMQQFEPTKEKN